MALQLDKAVGCMDEAKILDIIVALEAFPMTIDVLKSTFIGKKLVQIRKKLNQNKKCIETIDRIIVRWKKLVAEQGSSSTVKVDPNYDIFQGLSETRRKIIDAFSKELEKSIEIKKGQYTLRASSLSRTSSGSLSRTSSETKPATQTAASTYSTSAYLAYSLESSIDKKFPEQSDNNNYKIKVRSILSNLKTNEGRGTYLFTDTTLNSLNHLRSLEEDYSQRHNTDRCHRRPVHRAAGIQRKS